MAGYVLHLSEQENITLSAAVTRRLIDGGDGDAALLYLCLLKNRGSASPETLRAELKWDEARRSRAEAADRKSTRLNSSHANESRMPSSA